MCRLCSREVRICSVEKRCKVGDGNKGMTKAIRQRFSTSETIPATVKRIKDGGTNQQKYFEHRNKWLLVLLCKGYPYYILYISLSKLHVNKRLLYIEY